MGCRIQLSAFIDEYDQATVIFGFEGDLCETSVLILNENSPNSRLYPYGPNDFQRYHDDYEGSVRVYAEKSAKRVIVETFKDHPNPLINKLGERIKVGDYYYNDNELRTLIHGLRTVKPYHRNGSKNEYIRHLQHHNVNQETFVKPEPTQPEPVKTQPPPNYPLWATW